MLNETPTNENIILSHKPFMKCVNFLPLPPIQQLPHVYTSHPLIVFLLHIADYVRPNLDVRINGHIRKLINFSKCMTVVINGNALVQNEHSFVDAGVLQAVSFVQTETLSPKTLHELRCACACYLMLLSSENKT